MDTVNQMPEDWNAEQQFGTPTSGSNSVNYKDYFGSLYDEETNNQDEGLTETQAGMASSLIGAGTSVAGGIMEGVQSKRLREEAEQTAMSDIADARVEREKNLDLARQQNQLSKEQQEFEILKSNTGLRLQAFANDMAKEQQDFQDSRVAQAKLRKKLNSNNMYKDAFAQILGGSK